MSASRDFLVEIGTEELPPKSLLNLSAAFAEGVAKGLKDTGVAYKSLEAFATPRRLAVRVRKLIEQQPDRPLEKRGPPVKAAFDVNGAPTQAAVAFARGCGVDAREAPRACRGFPWLPWERPRRARRRAWPGWLRASSPSNRG